MSKTKIVGTIGPASNNKTTLRKMIAAGLNVARLNFSHGNREEHEKVVRLIRELSKEMNRPVAILQDLQGPKIRTGTLKNGVPVALEPGNSFQITNKRRQGSAAVVSTTYKKLPDDVKAGDRILIDDGLIELRVTSTTADTVDTQVVVGGELKEHKGINLPGVKVSAPSLTAKDKRDLNFGIEMGVDYVALSFVRTAEDVKHIKNYIGKKGCAIPVVAKIEKPEAVDNLDEILRYADVIMVARGDLGVELQAEQVPTVQKSIIHKTILANRLAITATQMLESMVSNPIPTRAEVSDVANAIYDGTSAIMLSAESATGMYPVKAVEMMARIAREAESSPFIRYNIQYKRTRADLITHAVAQSAVNILYEVQAKAIVAFTMSGIAATLISKQRPGCPVYAFTPSPTSYNRMALIWGTTPLMIPEIKHTEDLIKAAEEILIKKRYLKKNDLIVMMTGPALETGSTNLVKIHRVGRKD